MEFQVLPPDLWSLLGLQDLVLQEDLLTQAFPVFPFLPFLLYHLRREEQTETELDSVVAQFLCYLEIRLVCIFISAGLLERQVWICLK